RRFTPALKSGILSPNEDRPTTVDAVEDVVGLSDDFNDPPLFRREVRERVGRTPGEAANTCTVVGNGRRLRVSGLALFARIRKQSLERLPDDARFPRAVQIGGNERAAGIGIAEECDRSTHPLFRQGRLVGEVLTEVWSNPGNVARFRPGGGAAWIVPFSRRYRHHPLRRWSVY
ncbi:hypothetical protein, partial [Haloglomus irregulare]|uniref:hypothetical protein n=1 Tax=Haloglomus irregulare TaxID=2234134 RepID=UPI00163D6D16